MKLKGEITKINEAKSNFIRKFGTGHGFKEEHIKGRKEKHEKMKWMSSEIFNLQKGKEQITTRNGPEYLKSK